MGLESQIKRSGEICRNIMEAKSSPSTCSREDQYKKIRKLDFSNTVTTKQTCIPLVALIWEKEYVLVEAYLHAANIEQEGSWRVQQSLFHLEKALKANETGREVAEKNRDHYQLLRHTEM